jgi:lysylphosphatidylglycerol synthetase-like protein (DUF2156 family)
MVTAGALVVLVLTLYTFHRPYPVSGTEPAAYSRLNTVTAVLRQHFGASWPYLVLGFSVVLAALAFVLFLRSPDSEWKIDIQEPTATRVLMAIVCVFLVLAIALICLFIHVFLFQPPNPEVNSVVQTVETDAQRQERLTWLYGTALVLITLFGASFFIGYIQRATE